MAKIKYRNTKWFKRLLPKRDKVIEIAEQYAAAGWQLSLRQLYYALVSRDIIPNHQKEYAKLGNMVTRLREGGLLDWNIIDDRTRTLRGFNWQTDTQRALTDALDEFKTDHWAAQDFRLEIWVEKDALAQIVARAADKYNVRYFPCKGYMSTSALHKSARRLRGYQEDGQRPVIIYLGDLDPSGVNMPIDIAKRLRLYGVDALVERIALTWDQKEEFDPPPNPVKMKDSRAAAYIEEFGTDTCWELDALEPDELMRIITERIEEYIDKDQYTQAVIDERKKIVKARYTLGIHLEHNNDLELIDFPSDAAEFPFECTECDEVGVTQSFRKTVVCESCGTINRTLYIATRHETEMILTERYA